MEIGEKTKIDDLLNTYPFLVDILVEKSAKFKNLKNPIMRKTIGKVATLKQVAGVGGIPLEELIAFIKGAVAAHAGSKAGVAHENRGLSEPRSEADEKQALLKGIIRDLHKGQDMEVLKKRFRDLVKDVSPSEIAAMEQKLIEEGMPETEVKRLCDVHVQVFKESLERHEIPGAPPGHPVHTFMKENRAAEETMTELEGLLQAPAEKTRLKALVERLSEVHLHYLRKENQLFPLLEAHGISGPSSVMWAIHDDIRALFKKTLQETGAPGGETRAPESLEPLLTAVKDMIYKEEHILFPMALETLSDAEWKKVRQGEEEIGYAWVKPDTGWGADSGLPSETLVGSPMISLSTGALTPDLVDGILTHLPVDLTFVDENDRVAYYSAGKERIFPRSPGVIGREVTRCHPPRSIDVVKRILAAFRSGEKSAASFWIQLKGRFILIRYFAVRSAEGAYKGCLEVSQDITEIKKMEGERRLLNWE